MSSENRTNENESAGEEGKVEEQVEEVVEHVEVAQTTERPAAGTVVATMTPGSTVQPSSFMTRWRGGQWVAALVALLGPMALMVGIAYVFRRQLREVMEAVGF